MGNVVIANKKRVMKKILDTRAMSNRRKGRPKVNWKKQVKGDLRRAGANEF